MSNKTHRGVPEPGILLPGGQQVVKAIEFDGHAFPASPHPVQFPLIEMAYRARRGDKNASDMLNAFGVRIDDLRGYQYWPMVDGNDKPADLEAVSPVTGQA